MNFRKAELPTGGQATPDLMLLLGARLLRTRSLTRAWVLDEALIKSVTGDLLPVASEGVGS